MERKDCRSRTTRRFARGPQATIVAWLVMAGTAAATAAAHDTSVTKVRVAPSTDGAVVTFELNPADVLRLILDVQDRREFLDDAEFDAARRRAAEYVMNSTELLFDGRPATPEVLPSAQEPAAANAGADVKTIAVGLRWRAPAPGAKQATLHIGLYDKPEFAPIFEVSIERPGARDARVQYLYLNDAVTFDLPRAKSATTQQTGTTTPEPASAPPMTWWETAAEFLRLGFTHIVPYGLDHILFV